MSKSGENAREDNRGETEDAILLIQETNDFSVQMLHFRSRIDVKRTRRVSHMAMSRIHANQILPLKNQLEAMHLRNQKKVEIPLRSVSCMGGAVLNSVKVNWEQWPEGKPDKLTVNSFAYDPLGRKERSELTGTDRAGPGELQNLNWNVSSASQLSFAGGKRTKTQWTLGKHFVQAGQIGSDGIGFQSKPSNEAPMTFAINEVEIATPSESKARKLTDGETQSTHIKVERFEMSPEGSEAIPPPNDGSTEPIWIAVDRECAATSVNRWQERRADKGGHRRCRPLRRNLAKL